jgi:predicted signal transduction protein with EAL and GGDEF domain
MTTAKGPVAVTVSVGVACRASIDDSLDTLVERADQAMYTAKGDGRDRVISANGAGESRPTKSAGPYGLVGGGRRQ